jgi:hypothetical protein
MLQPQSTLKKIFIALSVVTIFSHCKENEEDKNSNQLFEYNDNITTRWSSPENMNGVQGQVAKKTTRQRSCI